MENALYVGLSRQIALQTQMNAVSNNVANMSTPGYQGQKVVFNEYLSEPKNADRELHMVLDKGAYRDLAQGPFKATNNQLDFALHGRGYFGIETPDGPQYTRAGNFQLNANRELVNASGLKVLDQAGGIITVPEGATNITVTDKGVLSTNDGPFANLMVVEFGNEQFLEQTAGNLFKAPENLPPVPSEATKVVQGFFESSNVQPILEMTKMIEILRSYQSTQRMLQTEHDRQRDAVRTLTRSG